MSESSSGLKDPGSPVSRREAKAENRMTNSETTQRTPRPAPKILASVHSTPHPKIGIYRVLLWEIAQHQRGDQQIKINQGNALSMLFIPICISASQPRITNTFIKKAFNMKD